MTGKEIWRAAQMFHPDDERMAAVTLLLFLMAAVLLDKDLTEEKRTEGHGLLVSARAHLVNQFWPIIEVIPIQTSSDGSSLQRMIELNDRQILESLIFPGLITKEK